MKNNKKPKTSLKKTIKTPCEYCGEDIVRQTKEINDDFIVITDHHGEREIIMRKPYKDNIMLTLRTTERHYDKDTNTMIIDKHAISEEEKAYLSNESLSDTCVVDLLNRFATYLTDFTSRE